jgi:acylphosphatase
LKAFEAWCRKGPPYARVQDVVVMEEEAEATVPFPFEIAY